MRSWCQAEHQIRNGGIFSTVLLGAKSNQWFCTALLLLHLWILFSNSCFCMMFFSFSPFGLFVLLFFFLKRIEKWNPFECENARAATERIEYSDVQFCIYTKWVSTKNVALILIKWHELKGYSFEINIPFLLHSCYFWRYFYCFCELVLVANSNSISWSTVYRLIFGSHHHLN